MIIVINMPKKPFIKRRPGACRAARRSSRRDAILEALISGPGHRNAEQIHAAARKRLPGIGIATVYRALKFLCGCGKISEFIPADGVARYEPAGSRAHHDHLICTSCGSFIEAVDPEIERLQGRLAARHGFKLSSHKLEIYGLCPGCAGTGAARNALRRRTRKAR
ncbi:MAG: Fur family transcriptional regulator ferric uptake regulator [Elusimicrobia bacterium]|nr:MAG: Fur family transcriptional regulator ferric uptake regulator [Elusimicrobiota bacterium]KAF0152057.1 MAG: Fur family transcriptional regulator ferric uptake regulator [Elusimicrobiota bacterium]